MSPSAALRPGRGSDEARVLRAVGRIPAGRVSTYGQVAREAGLGRRARFVGQVLSRLPAGSDVPWYRVLKADGRLAFPPDSDAYRRQRDRLEQEGVTFAGARINLDAFGWRATLDELLWGGGHC